MTANRQLVKLTATVPLPAQYYSVFRRVKNKLPSNCYLSLTKTTTATRPLRGQGKS